MCVLVDRCHSNTPVYLRSGAAQIHDVTATCWCTSGAELLRYTTSQKHAGVPQERSCSDTRRHSNMLVYLRIGAAQIHDVTATCWCISGAELLRYTTSQQHASVPQERAAQTAVHAATRRQKLKIKLPASPSHSTLPPGQPFSADPITPGRAASHCCTLFFSH